MNWPVDIQSVPPAWPFGGIYPMRGHLFIYIGGYKFISNHSLVVVTDDQGNAQAFPDRAVPAPAFEPGTTAWIDHGWAVGKNPKGPFCKWTNADEKKRAFDSFEDAVRFVYDLQRKRKRVNEVYSIVYAWKQANGTIEHRLVSSEDEIAAIDAQIEEDHRARQKAKADFDARHPDLDILKAEYGPMTAFKLSTLLKRIREDGEQAAFAESSKAKAYRDLAKLRKVGLID